RRQRISHVVGSYLAHPSSRVDVRPSKRTRSRPTTVKAASVSAHAAGCYSITYDNPANSVEARATNGPSNVLARAASIQADCMNLFSHNCGTRLVSLAGRVGTSGGAENQPTMCRATGRARLWHAVAGRREVEDRDDREEASACSRADPRDPRLS